MRPLTSPGAGPIPGVPQHQPSNLFRFGEITLYSAHAFGAAAAATTLANTTNRVFVTQLGGTGQGWPSGLTVSETNLKEPGRIPSGQAYDVFGVAGQCMAWDPTNDELDIPIVQAAGTNGAVADLVNVVNNGILAWDFTQTKVFICPLMLAGAGGGVYGAIASTAAASPLGAMNNGNGGIWMYRKHPVALPGNSTFSVEIQFGRRTAQIASGNGFAIRVVLLGYYKSVIEIG